MRIFLSAGEPSGDIHGANLIHALRRLRPDVECAGFGGERMEQAGCRLLYPLTNLAVMWFLRVLLNAHVFVRLLRQATRFLREERPDAVVLIDYPGFNWWVAKRAHALGIPVFYFVPPQLWAWAGWRVRKMRRWVDHVLCTLPFESQWYGARGVEARYVGHPFFDDLAQARPDAGFLADERKRGGPVIALLPGSRNQEIERNLSTLVEVAHRVHGQRRDVRFLIACLRPTQAEHVRHQLRDCPLPIEVCAGRTPEIIHLAHACVAVSGSVGLELLHHGKPAVVVYRISRLALRVSRLFMTTRYISLVNLLAGKKLYPEFLTDRCQAEAISEHILRWLNEPAAYAAVCAELAELRRQVGQPGACDRAARIMLEVLARPQSEPHAA